MSQEHVSPDPELNTIEAALGSLAPARSRIDRDRVMFRAGQAAVRPSSSGRRTWVAIAASLALIALGEAAVLAHRPPPQVIETVVVVHEPETTRVGPPPGRAVIPAPVLPEARPPGGYLGLGQTTHQRLAGQVLRYGLDGLSAPPLAAWSDPEPWPAPSHHLRQEELRKILHPGDPS